MAFAPIYWFGLYNFTSGIIPDKLFDCDSEKSTNLRGMIVRCLESDFDPTSLSADEADLTAELIADGFFTLKDGKFIPNFCVFTAEQYSQLHDNVLAKIEAAVADELAAIADDFSELCKRSFSEQAYKAYKDFIIGLALYDTIYYTEFFAMTDGKSYKPTNCADGELLTLFVRK
jgi:hypothetical protein